MRLFNSLSRKVEELEIIDKQVGVYTCGPTVYSYVTIGNWRTYTLGDLIVRVLKMNGYEVNYVMNITDVGHLTGDNLGDADTGEDRLEKAASKEGKTAWEIAAHYTNDFLYWYKQLNLNLPSVFCKATDHIQEQIELVEKLETRGLTYQINDGIYFDVEKYEGLGFSYGELSTLDQIQAGARVEINEEKRNVRDFALWKFSQVEEKRQMEWDSPWGKGFPGWHIECSAMSMKYLGVQFEIHVGGEDLRSTHHPNEIAQSQGANDKSPFVKYWVHGAFLLVDGGRMGKSLGNAYNLADVVEKGFDPLALRYFYFTGHYRKQLNFSWEGLGAAATTLRNLVNFYLDKKEIVFGSEQSIRDYEKYKKYLLGVKDGLPGSVQTKLYLENFMKALNDDLNMPEALSVIWKLIRDKSLVDNPKALPEILAIIEYWDEKILGFNLAVQTRAVVDLKVEVKELVAVRDEARADKDWQKSDQIRDQLVELGYEVEDGVEGTRVVKR